MLGPGFRVAHVPLPRTTHAGARSSTERRHIGLNTEVYAVIALLYKLRKTVVAFA
jgi:hypothetical protein